MQSQKFNELIFKNNCYTYIYYKIHHTSKVENIDTHSKSAF